jgi:hypothetical protein
VLIAASAGRCAAAENGGGARDVADMRQGEGALRAQINAEIRRNCEILSMTGHKSSLLPVNVFKLQNTSSK